jgi:hypothetical protein
MVYNNNLFIHDYYTINLNNFNFENILMLNIDKAVNIFI